MTKIMYRRLHMKFTSHHSYMINNIICVNFLRFNATSIHFKIGCWHHNNHMKATVTLVNAPPLPNTGQLRHHNRRWCCSIVPSRSICSMSKWSLHSWLTLLGIHSCWNTYSNCPAVCPSDGFHYACTRRSMHVSVQQSMQLFGSTQCCNVMWHEWC